MWAPIQTGVLTLTAGDTTALLVNSVLETTLGREVRQFTVTRVIAKIYLAPYVNDQVVYMTHGMRIENENVASDAVDPADNETADWILHGTVWASGSTAAWNEARTVNIDNRSQRKSQGEESELRWYVKNVGASNTQYVAIQGRALLLLP